MRVVIIEDETAAAQNLATILHKVCPDIEIVDTIDTVVDSVEFFRSTPQLDLVFMDIHLADGASFRIFNSVKVATPIIFTTAYYQYAIEAFKVNSIDYLLKPITESDMRRAWERCKERISQQSTPNIETLVDMVTKAGAPKDREYKRRFIVKMGEKILIIPVEEIAYCYSEDKSTYAVNKNGTRRLLDYSLDMVQEMLDPKLFFRISRSYIVSINAIENISKHLGTRLKMQLNPPTAEEVVVSRSRTSDFLEWLDNN